MPKIFVKLYDAFYICRMIKFCRLLILVLFVAACQEETPPPVEAKESTETTARVPLIPYTVKAYHAHDVLSFTEGLTYYQDKLYESTGSPQDMPELKSVLGELDLKSGKITVRAELDRNKYFGEGIAFFQNKVYQLTYQTQTGFIYDASSFRQIKTFKYQNAEGWGMTTDSVNLIMSDGSSNLTYWNPENLQVVKTLAVTENGSLLSRLNELEFIRGYIYANVWTTHEVVKIDPATGKVVAKFDFNSLDAEVHTKYPQALEMNGLAYNPSTNRLMVTGKLWPTVYEIEAGF
jgi:glutamine cyclotransferase